MHDLGALLDDAALVPLRRLLEDNPDAVLSLTAVDGMVLWASRAGAARVFRRELQDFAGRPADDFVHPEDRAGFARALRTAMTGETSTWEGRTSTADGRWIQVRSVQWRTRDGSAIVAVTVPR